MWNFFQNCGIQNLSMIFLGTVIRTGAVKLLETEREYVCSRCKQSFTMEADFEQYYAIPKPVRLGTSYVVINRCTK